MADSTYAMTIAGKRVSGEKRMAVVNPATGLAFAEAPDCTREELDQAVAAARAAFPAWSARPIAERQDYVRGLARVLAENADALKGVFTSEQGKPHEDARLEMLYASMYAQGAAMLAPPTTIIEDTPERRVEVRHVPIGVAGAIVPWNFPVLLAVMKICPALLAGCCMVLKPSPFTPLTMLRLGELLMDVLPPGVLNIVSGGDDLGPWLTAHGGIDKISFTGSTATGRKVMESAAPGLKRITLELGGNDPAIVLPDVDVEATAPILFWAAFLNNAQLCLATKRMYIHADIYDRMARAIVAYGKTIKVGDGAQQGTQLGPIQNKRQFERVKDLLADAQRSGLKFLMGGEAADGEGYFIPVTIIDNPPENSRVVREEAFGPVLPLLKFDDIEDVIARANDSEYGLGASVWSADPEKARAVGERLQAGMVWINEIHYQTPFTPLAGHKQSGMGVENGLEGVLQYTNPQTIVMRKHQTAQAAA